MWKSYLWQNFLKDSKYTNFIIERIQKNIDKYWFSECFEIGPWKGALTKRLITVFNEIVLFEKDESFREILQGFVPDWKIVRWDVLEQDLSSKIMEFWFDINNILVAGNIPYYITSPIFRKFFVENKFKYGIFMIQKEVWEKIKTDAEKKSYLRWLLNYSNDVKYLKTVPAKAFSPVPKVDSCLVEIVSSCPKPFDFNKMIEILDLISPYKRKSMGKILKILEKKWYKIDFDENLILKRPEDLTWEDMSQIVESY